LTVCDWGVEGIDCNMAALPLGAPEYYFYVQYAYISEGGTQYAPSLDAYQVGNLTNKKYSYFGIGNTYNAKELYWYYSTNNYNNSKEYTFTTAQMWGLDSERKVYQVMGVLDWLIQDYVLGGLTTTYTQNDMVFGWNSKLIEKLVSNPVDSIDYNDEYYKSGDTIYYAK